MSLTRSAAVGRVGLATVVFALFTLTAAAAPDAPPLPQPGEVQRLPVITLSMRVGSTEKETRQVTYAPPPGWYVRGHSVSCTAKFGNSSFAVSTVPQDWGWLSEDKVDESYRTLMDLAGKAADHGLQAKFAQEREATLRELRQVKATHHALVVEATARGEGFLRGGGGLDLVVTAEIVYLGTDEHFQRLADNQREKLH